MTCRGCRETKNLTTRHMSNCFFLICSFRKLNTEGHYSFKTSEKLKVGNIIKVHHNERIPADLVLLYTTEKSGSVFIRTDQLDGETDWKLRKAVTKT